MNWGLLKNKNCFITGATGGIGRELAKILAGKNCNLFLTGRNEKKLNQLKKELETDNEVKVGYQPGDLTNLEDIKKIIKKTREIFDSIDILINSAGIFISKSIQQSTIEDFENCFNVNIRAAFLFCKEFSQDMTRNKWGRIVNVGSSSSYEGFKNGSIYCASKHSILGLSRALNNELKDNNVRTYCVSPGSTKTDMGRLSNDQDFNTFLDPKEVAEFITFLILFDKEMIIDETRLSRMILK